MAYKSNRDNIIWEKSGSAVYVPAGSWNKRNGDSNKAYMVFSFLDSNTGASSKLFKVKIYGESVYTPSSGRHKDRACCPVSVAIMQGFPVRPKTIETRGGAGVFVQEGAFTKRNGEANKAYVRFSFQYSGSLYVLKVYSQSTYVPSSGRHKDKNCAPVRVTKYRFTGSTSSPSRWSRNWGGNPRGRVGGGY